MNMHVGNVSEATNVLESAYRLGAAERVRDFVVSRSEGILVAEPDDEDVRLYREFEGRKMAEMEDRLDVLLGNTVIPMAVGYVRHRFPERKNEEFPRIDNVFLIMDYTISERANIVSWELPVPGKLLWSCGMRESASGVDLEISVNLDAFFKELENVELNDEEFDDLAVQVLLHEVMHAISSNKYLTTPGEREARAKWLAFVEGLSDSDVDPAWESLISRFGYSCNFASPAISLDEMQISTLPLVNSFNEGLTDILAAKAYAHHFRSRGESQERKYSVSYAGEAKALHMALREYAQVKNRHLREVMREVEEGYFFGDSEFLRTFEEIVWPSLTAFQEYIS